MSKVDGGKFSFVDYFSPTCVPLAFLNKLSKFNITVILPLR